MSQKRRQQLERLEQEFTPVFRRFEPSDHIDHELLSHTKAQLFQKLEQPEPITARKMGFLPLFNRLASGVISFVFVFSVFAFALFNTTPHTEAHVIGNVSSKGGNVTIYRGGEVHQVTSDTELFVGDVIEVDNDAEAELNLYEQGKSQLSSNSRLSIADVRVTSTEEGTQQKEVHVHLEKGKLSQNSANKPDDAVSSTLLIATKKGTVKASEDATFTIDVEETSADQVAVVVQTEEIDNPFVEVALNTDDDPIILVTSDKVEPTSVATTLVSSIAASTGALLAEEQAKAQRAEEAMQLLQQKQQQLHKVTQIVELAEIKLYGSLEAFEAHNDTKAMALAEGYVTSISRLALELGEATNHTRSFAGSSSKSLSKSDLASLADKVEQLVLEADPTSDVARRVRSLYAQESSIILHMNVEKYAEKTTEPMAVTEKATLTTAQQRMMQDVETIMSIEDEDVLREKFVEYLDAIPADERYAPMLETIESRVPEQYQGYVFLKLQE